MMVEWLVETADDCCGLEIWNGPTSAHPKMVLQAVGVFLGPALELWSMISDQMSPPRRRSILGKLDQPDPNP